MIRFLLDLLFGVKVKFESLNPMFEVPAYATKGAACFDLRFCGNQTIVIAPGSHYAVPLGFAVEIPNGYELQIRPRSGLAFKHRVTLLNSPGIIDADYRGEVRAILINHGDDAFMVHPGDRVCQGALAKVIPVKMEVVANLSETKRGSGGLGSTGVA